MLSCFVAANEMIAEGQSTIALMDWLPIAISSGALLISLISLGWNFSVERKKRKAKPQIWQWNNFYGGDTAEETKINLVIRNLSQRPTAIIDIKVRNSEGNVITKIDEQYDIFLPIKIEPWDVKIVHFRIEKDKENNMSDILISDIDDNEIIVKRTPDTKWHG